MCSIFVSSFSFYRGQDDAQLHLCLNVYHAALLSDTIRSQDIRMEKKWRQHGAFNDFIGLSRYALVIAWYKVLLEAMLAEKITLPK